MFLEVFVIVLAVLTFAAIVSIGIHQTISQRENWYPWETTRGPIMRRRYQGMWETREMSPEEQNDWHSKSVW